MKKLALSLALALTLSVSGVALAGEEYHDSDSHPLKVAAHLVHPVGAGLEWIVFRPLHFIMSRPGLDKVFGHDTIDDGLAMYEPIE